MTMTTADTGALAAAHHDVTAKDSSAALYLFAAVILLGLVAATAFFGLGGLILCGVGATWAMLALLVVMTAGG